MKNAKMSVMGEIRKPLRNGLMAATAFFVLGIGWAATAPLESASVASGIISSEVGRRTVQHLEGGIVREILVSESEKVREGQPILVMEDISAQADYGKAASRLRSLAAMAARLEAVVKGEETVTFGHPILSDRSSPEVAKILGDETARHRTALEDFENRKAILDQRVGQLEEQIVGVERQLEGIDIQLGLLAQEIRDVQELLGKGLARKPRLLELQREKARLIGMQGELTAKKASMGEAIGETRLQAMNLNIGRIAEAEKELGGINAEIAGIEKTLEESKDRLDRTTLHAPVSGTVLNMKAKTTGGVIRPGEPIMDIVPENDRLVVKARLNPSDIDSVHAGLKASIVFPAVPVRHQARLEGEVESVSADAVQDEGGGDPYFVVYVGVDRGQIAEKMPDFELKQGMPAEAFISLGEQTVLEYIVQPLVISVMRGMREE